MPQLHVNHEYLTNYGATVKIVALDKSTSPFVYVADNGDRYTSFGRCNLNDEDYDIDEEVVAELTIQESIKIAVDSIQDNEFLEIILSLLENKLAGQNV